MNRHLLFLAALTAAAVPLSLAADSLTDPTPSLVVEHWYGNDSYPVDRGEYDIVRINPRQSTYTLVSNTGQTTKDLNLSYDTYPRVFVKDVAAKEIVTSKESVSVDDRKNSLTYCNATYSLQSNSAESLDVVVYNVGGLPVIAGRVGGNTATLSMASLPEGMYIATALGSGTSLLLKFVKY